VLLGNHQQVMVAVYSSECVPHIISRDGGGIVYRPCIPGDGGTCPSALEQDMVPCTSIVLRTHG
jgi:hypothetical protein